MSMRQATDISLRVRKKVIARDSIDGAPCCIYCGAAGNIQIAHFVPRSRGGIGEETNLACLCPACHGMLDNGDGRAVREVFRDRLERLYPGWKESEQIYTKW